MPDIKKSQKRFLGISDYLKEGQNGQIPDLFYFSRSINFRDDPQSLTLMPGSIKESGTIVTDLLKWGDIIPTTLESYFYGNAGNFYKRSTAGSWTKIGTISNSHGNGLAYFTGDDYVYMTQDNSISRYGPISNNPQLTQNFLQAQGGIPLNSYSLLLASASSQYATAADSATLSITGDLTIEAFIKPTTLPAVGTSMTIIGKWDESGALRSYKLDLYGVSGYFGDGSDGSLTISTNTTESPIDSVCTGTLGTQILTATNGSFAQGQVILIHQTQGTNSGKWERNTINGYTAGTITLGTPLINSYITGAQVRVLKQFTNVTINSGITYTAKAWNGSTGGIIGWLASGTATITGIISASGKGFRGGVGQPDFAYTGEGDAGASFLVSGQSRNGNGGGGGHHNGNSNNINIGGGGGGNGDVGNNGVGGQVSGGLGGNISGSADLTTMNLGGGGGGTAHATSYGGSDANGAIGGGIVYLTQTIIAVTGSILANGNNGSNGDGAYSGAGAGGSVLLKSQTATLGASLITANGGTGQLDNYPYAYGGAGRVHIDYYTSYTGTTTPTINATQDNNLVTTNTTQARLGISSDGTTSEYLSMNLSTISTGIWNRLSVAWTASTATANFYLNAILLGSFIGTKTSIHDNASLLYLGANKGASSVQNFANMVMDDVRLWSNVQTVDQILTNLSNQVPIASAGLNAYFKLNNAYTDATGHGNTLTASGAPVFVTDVAFPAPTTRLDLDNQNSNVGQNYTLLSAISESSNDTLPLSPVNDPQASIAFYVDTKGAGDWTVTIHDQQDRVIATKTISNSGIPASGFIEFIFSSPWNVNLKQTYHAHLTVSSSTSKVVTGTTVDFSTAEYQSFFGFLVPDSDYHPIMQFQYQPLGGSLTGAMIIGNGRYVAIWDGFNYLPNFITLSPGWRVKCFAQWRNYVAIGVWKAGDITSYHQGRLYFWTGYQPAYDFLVDVPEGQINALHGVDSDLYMFAGFRGTLLDYKGGYYYNTGNSSSAKLKRMPLLEPSAHTEVFPGALNMWRGLLHFGLYGDSDSVTSQKGVYSYGTLNQYYPETLSYDYPISTGNRTSTVSIGCVFPVGENLIIGWKDGAGYGADVVNFSNPPASNGEIQLLIDDNNTIWHDSNALKVRADYLSLLDGQTITPEINLERAGFLQLDTDSTVGSNFITQSITNGRVNEVQTGVTMTQTNGISPTLLGITLNVDDLANEQQI